MRTKKQIISFFCLFIFFYCCASPVFSQSYTFSTLANPLADSCDPHGISNNGIVAGDYNISIYTYGFIDNNNLWSKIAYPNAYTTEVYSINTSGQAVGYYQLLAEPAHGFYYFNGNFTAVVDPAHPTLETYVRAINDNGLAVGDHGSSGYPFVYNAKTGLYTSIGDETSVNYNAYGINNNGIVLGSYNQGGSGSFTKTLLYNISTKTYSYIDSPAGWTVEAQGLNDFNQVAGYYLDSNSFSHGFVYSGGKFVTIDDPLSGGTSTMIKSINNNGVVVGISYNAQTNFGRAFIAVSDSPSSVSPKNCGSCLCTGACVGNPINAGVGNKFQREKDFRGGPGTELALDRFYNSQDNSSSAFGVGWHSTYHRSVTQTSSSTVTITRADGRQDTFTLTSGTWTADPDVTSRLTATGSGWKLVTKDDETENYNSSGQLTSIVLRSGLTTTLAYSNGSLSTVTGPFGHALTFVYNTSGRISQVTAPDGGVFKYAYDSNNNLVSVTYPGNVVRQYLYENASFPNALTGIVDEKGNRFATYAYDSEGRAVSSEHAGGVEKTSIAYNSNGTAEVTDALGNSRDYAFTTQFDFVKPTSVSNQGCSCGAQAYTYDANGFIASQTDFNGNVTTYTHDLRGLELSRTEASGTAQARTITTTWNSVFHLPLTITEPNRTTSYTYDAKGNVLTKTVTAGNLTRTWTYTYNANGQVLTETNPNGHATTYTYNSKGGVATITNALGHVTSITGYDTNGRPLTIQDPNGLTITLAYDVRGHLTSRTAGTETTVYAYDVVGNITKITLPDGSDLAMSYDAAQRLTGVSDNLGNHIAYTLDLMSNRTKEEVFDPSSHLKQTRSHVYDQLNRLFQDIGAQNQTTTYGHDNNGNLTSVTDSLSHVTQNSYDALNRLIRATDPTNAITSVAYNANDLITGVTDPRGLATAYVYDGLGDRTSTQSPDTGTTSKTYDAAGNVLTSTDARGKKTTYTYDALNRPTGMTFADGTGVTFVYDQGSYGKGHLTTMTDSSGTTSWTYDTHGRILTKQQKVGNVTLTTSYTYDSATGKPSSVTYPSGRQLNYTYDTVSKKLASIKVGSATLISGLTYQPFGPVASWAQGSGKTYARSFDQDGRLVGIAIGGSLPEGVSLTYDAAGRITGINDSAAAPKIGNTGTTNFQYAATSNRQTGSTGGMAKTYTYDAAGNILGDGTATFTYGANGRLAQVTKGGTTIYTINGLGQRVAKAGAGADGGTVYFVYDEAGHLIGEYDTSGNVIKETVWLGDLPVGVLKTGAVYYVNPDHLGAPLSITDASGKDVWRWDRDPYGNGRPNENPSGLGTFTYNLRLPGQYYDKETELHYNYFRDYNPKTGRYVQSDPVGLKRGINTYDYTTSSPINNIDPLGLWSLTGELYAPWGGGFVFGQNQNGRYFLSLRVGLGLGGGISYDPEGKCPGLKPDTEDAHGVNIGGFMDVGVGLGPFSWGISGEAGAQFGTNNEFTPYIPYVDPGANYVWDFGLKLRAGGSTGGQLTFYLN